jgi:hypothetical protein
MKLKGMTPWSFFRGGHGATRMLHPLALRLHGSREISNATCVVGDVEMMSLDVMGLLC